MGLSAVWSLPGVGVRGLHEMTTGKSPRALVIVCPSLGRPIPAHATHLDKGLISQNTLFYLMSPGVKMWVEQR